jgi:AmmeMemoRadiSam system protein A
MPVDSPPPLSTQDRSELVGFARRALSCHLDGKEMPGCHTDSAALLEPRASFVTLRRRDTGQLRGCRGERTALQPLIQSVGRMVIAAATDDPRFDAVTPEEAPHLSIQISALGPMQRVQPEQIVLGRHGLTIIKGDRVGLLLPSVPQAFGWDLEQFLEALCEKARLPADAYKSPRTELYAFETESWGESS